ncbi:MAG: anti-sigma factor family protein [Devosia sp.]
MTDALLLGFADGKLVDTECVAVERYLAQHPEKAAEVAHWQRQNEALRALFAPVANEPVPPRLDPHLLARGRPANPNFNWPQMAAAAVVLIALGSSIGWFGRDFVLPRETQNDILIENAVTAHALFVQEKRHAVEVAASEKDHLLSWLSNRIARPIESPDLSGEGFALVGGRLLPASAYSKAGPAAQLMYENAAAERVTVYITAALPDRANGYEVASRNALDAFYWANDAITCTVVGNLPAAQMQVVAKKVYQELTRRPDANYWQL